VNLEGRVLSRWDLARTPSVLPAAAAESCRDASV
jgi:hypothetical protein